MNSNPESNAEGPTSGKHNVGYGRPPEATRFKKGQSGNPKGRPKGNLNVDTLITKASREKVVVNENGRRKKVTKIEAAIKQVTNKAASGNERAFRDCIDLLRHAEAAQNPPAAEHASMGSIDQEVIHGILQRFQGQDQKTPSQESREEANHDDDPS